MRWIGCLSLAACLAFSGGCALQPDAPAPPTYYRLQLPSDAELPQFPTRSAVLAIGAPDAPGDLRGPGIAYVPRPHQLRYYSRNQWTDSPPRMLEAALVSAFERSKLFRGVVRDGAGRADYRLHTELLRLEQNFSGDDGSIVELAMRVQLTELQDRALLGSRVITVRVPAPSDNAQGAVQAAHTALTQALAEILNFTAASLPSASR